MLQAVVASMTGSLVDVVDKSYSVLSRASTGSACVCWFGCVSIWFRHCVNLVKELVHVLFVVGILAVLLTPLYVNAFAFFKW
jgi:hypothetical protein